MESIDALDAAALTACHAQNQPDDVGSEAVDAKTNVAVRRVVRLENNHDEQEDEEHEASLMKALADKTKFVKMTVGKWFVDKCFGCGKAQIGEIVFFRASVVQGAEVLKFAWTHVCRSGVTMPRRGRGVPSTEGIGKECMD